MPSLTQSAGGMKAAPYHGGMKSKERIRAQNAWRSGEVQVMRPVSLQLQPDVRPCVPEYVI